MKIHFVFGCRSNHTFYQIMFAKRSSIRFVNRPLISYDDDIFGESTNDCGNGQSQRQKDIDYSEMKSSSWRKANVMRLKNNQNYRNNLSKNNKKYDLNNDDGCLSKRYQLKNMIGRGTYGEVFKAIDRLDKTTVAIKRILCQSRKNTLYEEESLKALYKCDNVTKLLRIYQEKQSNNYVRISLVMEYCPFDLFSIISDKKVSLALDDIKGMMMQILAGVEFIHDENIIHRDIKTENILMTSNGVIKIGDFGLSVEAIRDENKRNYTSRVVTLWYRAPELLLGDKKYSNSIDIWSVGCVMGEFWQRGPILPGESEIQQIHLISRLCGTINTEVWPNVYQMPLFETILLPTDDLPMARTHFYNKTRCADAADLISSLLQINPKKRLSARDARNHDFFWFDPLPSNLKSFAERICSFYANNL